MLVVEGEWGKSRDGGVLESRVVSSGDGATPDDVAVRTRESHERRERGLGRRDGIGE